MKELARSEQPRWLNQKPMKEINRVREPLDWAGAVTASRTLSRVTTYGFWRSQSSNEARYSTIPLREYSRWPSLRNWFI